MSINLDTLFSDLDTGDLPKALEGRWLRLGSRGYDYLLSTIRAGDGVTEKQMVNGILILSRMRFERDPEDVRAALAKLASDSRLPVRSVATRCLVGTLRSEVLHRGSPAPRAEHVEAIRRGLDLGLEDESEAFVVDSLRALNIRR